MNNKFKQKYKNLSTPAKASLWYTFSNVLVKGIALLSTPIFTRIMPESDYGSYTIFQSWFGIFIIFTSLNIFLGGYTKGQLLYKDDLEGYTSSSLGLMVTITCVWGLVYLINVPLWTKLFELSPELMAAMFIELLLMPAYELWSSRQRFDYKYLKVVIASIAMSVMSIVLGIATVSLSSDKLAARVYSDIFAKAVIAIVLFVGIFVTGKKFYNRRYWKYNLIFNITLIPHYLSNYVLSQSDRLMISRMIGNAQAAYYSVAYTISMMMNLIVNAINNALNPYIYQSIDSGKKEKIKDATRPLFLIIAGLCILTMAFAPEIIRIFASPSYYEAVYVVPPIAASVYFIFLYSMFSTIEYYFQKTVRIAIATTISAGLNIVLNYIFIKLFGYYAAGYTTLVSYILLAFMHYIFYRSVIKENLNTTEDIYDIKVMLILSVAVLGIMFVMTLTYKTFVVRYCIIAVLLIIAIKNRKKIASMMSVIRNKEQ